MKKFAKKIAAVALSVAMVGGMFAGLTNSARQTALHLTLIIKTHRATVQTAQQSQTSLYHQIMI